jgi:GNAT superfamily N-acetyltransferase
MAFHPERPDLDWLLAWATGRSLARGLPAPFADRGGWRAEIGSDPERRRWLFASLTPDLHALAESISEPGFNLRALATPAAMQACLPAGWSVQAASFAMVGPSGRAPPVTLPARYRLELREEGAAAHAFVFHADGDLAAWGHSGVGENAFVYDRIVTQPGHRRQGLGRAIMASLGQARRDPGQAQLLVATEAGRMIYRSLGWKVIAPYASASWTGDSSVQNRPAAIA